MSQRTEPSSQCLVEKLSSIRSPADGEEQYSSRIHDEDSKKRNPYKMSSTEATRSEGNKTRDDSPVTSEHETPPYLRWAQNLSNLLHDNEGVQLLKTYLGQENPSDISVEFWFACKGLKEDSTFDQSEHTLTVIKILYRKYVCCLPDISSATKREISSKIDANVGLDRTIFDKAQKEVESVIRKTIYPNFLRSDVYIQHVQNSGASHTPDNEAGDSLDSESMKSTDSKSSEENSTKTTAVGATNFKSPHESLDLLQTVFEDSELELTACNNNGGGSSNNNNNNNNNINNNNNRVSRMVQKSLYKWNRFNDMGKTKPESQAGLYLKANTPGYNTVYTKYAGYLPPSAQDSELQSISSDAQTDDSLSVVSNSNDCSAMRSNKAPKKCHKSHKTQHGALFNKETYLPCHNFIPRTERLQRKKDPSPQEFITELTEKLLKVQRSRNLEERLNERLQEELRNESLTSSKVDPTPQQKPAPPLLTLSSKSQDAAQEILDNHVSRVFKDSSHATPSPSPGCLTPSAPQLQSEKQRDILGGPSGNEALYQFNSTAECVKHSREYDNFSNEAVDCSLEYDALRSSGFLKHPHYNQNQGYQPIEQSYDHSMGRHGKDYSRRGVSKRATPISDYASFDSGFSGTDITSCSSQENKKLLMYNNSRSRTLDSASTSQWSMPAAPTACLETAYYRGLYAGQQSQPLAQDPNMLPLPDTGTQLLETRRRLESICSLKPKFRKSSRKPSAPAASTAPAPNNDVTLVAYCFGRASVPFLSRVPGKSITLRQFKSLISKKGNFKYFFKKENEDFGVVFEEISDDSEILPLWEGKVFGLVEQMEV